MRIALDTNCLLDAADEASPSYAYVQRILTSAAGTDHELFVSRHSLSELKKASPQTERAKHIARGCQILPHYPIGTWDDQVATWDEVSGSWDDARRNQGIQRELEALAKAGSGIRDRGAYIDSLLGGVDVFVTSDRQLAAAGPAARIRERFGLRVLTPEDVVSELCSEG